MALPKRADLFLYQGDSWVIEVLITGDPAPNVSDWEALAQIRKGPADTHEVSAEITTVITEPQKLNLSMPPEETLKLCGDYEWDLNLKDTAGTVTTVLAGKVRVDPEVSR
jgi:hypothetical protein